MIVEVARSIDAERRGADRRHRLPRAARARRHAPAHLAVALPEHRLRLDARALLHRACTATMSELYRPRTRTPATCSARSRRSTPGSRRCSTGRTTSTRPSTPTRPSTRSVESGCARRLRPRRRPPHWQPLERARRIRPTTCAAFASSTSPRTTGSSRSASRRAATSSRRSRSRSTTTRSPTSSASASAAMPATASGARAVRSRSCTSTACSARRRRTSTATRSQTTSSR